ncbi:MAG: hypothetical protein EB060_09600 [Proteobacteria bacterium]|nr:hypothetical protein [Pseudomonadota bacterium]
MSTTVSKPKSDTTTERKLAWDEARLEILSKVDVEAEYIRWGCRIAGEPGGDGWQSCYSMGRDESTPSAGINVGDGPHRGRYRDFGSSGNDSSLSFFFAAATFGGIASAREAVKHYADVTGVKLPESDDPMNWESQVEFIPWADHRPKIFASNKPPIVGEAIQRMGGVQGNWPRKSKDPQTVYAFPIYGPQLLQADPIGWVVMQAFGKKLVVYQGKGKHPKEEKTHTLKGSRSGLMNRFALERLADAEVIWKVEGVSDCLTLESIIPEDLRGKHIVITNSAGATERPKESFAKLFAGKTVYVLHDADKPGQAGAVVWSAILAEKGAITKNIQLPYTITETHGKDVRDWVNEGGTYEQLLAIAEASDQINDPNNNSANDATSTEDVVERQICNLLEIDVLGETESGHIIVYTRRQKKVVTITDIQRLGMPKLKQICGRPADIYVTDKPSEGGKKEGEQEKFQISEVREAIALLGGKNQIDDASMLGQGLWPVDGHAVIVVNGGSAAVWNGKKILEPNESPFCRGRILDLKNSEPWVDFGKLQTYLDAAADPKFCLRTINETITLFGRWKWARPHDVEVITGLVMATFTQVFFDWRPQVGVLGKSASGKTTLFELLSRLFGKLVIRGEKPTEAGLRQAIGNSSRAILLDEFEHDRHRQQVLELIRTSSRGESSAILRGTADQKGKRFSLRHICWVAAIEIGLNREPDQNRFIKLELQKPDEDKRGLLNIPSEQDCHDLGLRLLAVAISRVWESRSIAAAIKSKHGTIPDRVVESYSVPVGVLAATTGMTTEQARARLEAILDAGGSVNDVVSDEQELIETILSADVWVGGGKKSTVGRLLSGDFEKRKDETGLYEVDEDPKALEDVGITRTNGESLGPRIPWTQRPMIFFCHAIVRQKLLRGTRWENSSIEQILRGIEGSSQKSLQRRIGGQKKRGIEIPATAIGIQKEEF